jgi:hypothetical protein
MSGGLLHKWTHGAAVAREIPVVLQEKPQGHPFKSGWVHLTDNSFLHHT